MSALTLVAAMHAAGYLLFGFVVASIIVGALWLVRDFTRWSRAYDAPRSTTPECCWGCSPTVANPACRVHAG